MESYPSMFLSSSSAPRTPFMAMDMMMGSHHRHHYPTHRESISKVVDADHHELVGGEFLGLQMLNMEPEVMSSSSNNTNISGEGGRTGCNDSRDKGLVFEAGSEAGQPRFVAGMIQKGENHQASGKTSKGKVRSPRFAFQTRSHVDILDDGYRWRKYGQKAVKKNKFPRSYYRCTFQGCNVKKQVQRLEKDEGIVVTTYEGVHSHPIEKCTDNFEHILSQFQIYNSI